MTPSRTTLCASLIVLAACGKNEPASEDAGDLLQQRKQLDATVWANEVEANQREAAFVELWDELRAAEDKFAPLAGFELASIALPKAVALNAPTDLDIELITFGDTRPMDAAGWRNFVGGWKAAGWRIVQTDWHHSRYIPNDPATGRPGSEVDFNIHAIQPATKTAVMLKGQLRVDWSEPPAIEVTNLTAHRRQGGGFFRPLFTEESGGGQFTSSNPLIVYDLDGDGLSEILFTRWNRVLRNRGGLKFDREPLFAHPIPLWESAIVSDFDGDRIPDLVAVGKDGYPQIFRGSEGGQFKAAPERCASATFTLPSVVTAGDIDADGDLDLWMTQYRLSFDGGQMPTPYYDANDGHPSYLLRNDGSGKFTDITEEAGLSPLRMRRTYSTSFIDLDGDHDLDLVNTADYAGVDIYRNDGNGTFELATTDFIDERHSFGMGNTFADYDRDGRLDFYVIGMSSTTARRLDRLGLGREDRPDIHAKRAAMGYGNRLYFGSRDRFEERPALATSVARTGWSWGVTSADFDLDGDHDIYVANGHRSGKSTQDYCTNFWRHDIYTGDSNESQAIASLFQKELADLNRSELSWNGYEKNPLLLNRDSAGKPFADVGFLFGLGFQYDARAVVSDDLDADGRPDLLVAQSNFDGKGFVTRVHAYRNELALPAGRSWVSLDAGQSGATLARLKTSDGKTQSHWFVTGDSFAAQHAPVAHFGLPEGVEPVEFVTTWPSGMKATIPAQSGGGRRYQIPVNKISDPR